MTKIFILLRGPRKVFLKYFQSAKNSVMRHSRADKLSHFYSLCDSNHKILDVGVSSNEHNDSVNFFLRNFKFSPSQYTGLAVQSMEDIRTQHPGKIFVEYSGGIFPFETNEFDWVFSNAVIEHVGNKKDQLLFLNEMLRVGKKVFFTTPSKWFPVESHTNAFILHWFDDYFYKWCEKYEPDWNPDNLLLLTGNDLSQLMQDSTSEQYKIQKNRILGWPMTFTVVCS